jgi:hypothetical protein
MGNLVYITNGSPALLIDDEHGSLDWRAPSDEPFVHPTNLIRPFGSHHYGRRLHDATAPWETPPELAAQSDLTAESACIWAAAPKGTAQ